jgi:hypothetical protein
MTSLLSRFAAVRLPLAPVVLILFSGFSAALWAQSGPPTLTSVTPNALPPVIQYLTGVQLNGTNFTPDATVAINTNDSSQRFFSVTVVNSTTITAGISLGGLALGTV